MSEILTKLIADGLVIVVILIGAAALLWRIPKGHRLDAYSRVLMAGLTAYLVAKLVGSIYQPELTRPFEQMGVSAGASYLNNPGFPSDHVLFCTAITLAVWFEVRSKQLLAILLGLTLAVGAGRVLALVHTPFDVVGGLIIACVGIPWYLQRDKHKLITNQYRQKINNGVK